MSEHDVVFTGVFDARQRQLSRLTRRFEEKPGKKHATLRKDHHNIPSSSWRHEKESYRGTLNKFKRPIRKYTVSGINDANTNSLNRLIHRSSPLLETPVNAMQIKSSDPWRKILALPSSISDHERVQRSVDIFIQSQKSNGSERKNGGFSVSEIVELGGTLDGQGEASFGVQCTLGKKDAQIFFRNSRIVLRTPDEQFKAELSYSDQTHKGFLQLRERDGIRLHDTGVVGLSVEPDNRLTRISFVGSAVNLQTMFAIFSAPKK